MPTWRATSVVVAAVMTVGVRPASAQVLCAWEIYVALQAATSHCGWERQPIDDAVDDAVATIDGFIIENSSVAVSQKQLDESKAKRRADLASQSNVCVTEPEDQASFAGSLWVRSRGEDPEELLEGVAAMLAVPDAPTMNPCL